MYQKLLSLRDDVQLPDYLETIFVLENGEYPLIQQICFNVVTRKHFQKLAKQPAEHGFKDKELETLYIALDTDTQNFLRLMPDQVCLLMGRRATAGSIDVPLPISRAILEKTALKRTSDKDQRTQLNRALCKHKERATGKHWGVVKGSIPAVNQIARQVLEDLLDRAEWINWHQVAPGEVYYEVRDAEGFGARWKIYLNASGVVGSLEFRGLLEPFL